MSSNPVKDGSDKFESVKTGDYGKFDSQCDKTMVGFVQTIPTVYKKDYTMTKHKVVCFYGEQDTHYDMEKTVSVKTESDTVKVAVITSQNKIVSQPLEKPADKTNVQLDDTVEEEKKTLTTSRTSKKRFNAHMDHEPSDENDKAISFINKSNLGWKADVCKLQKHHSDYGKHCDGLKA